MALVAPLLLPSLNRLPPLTHYPIPPPAVLVGLIPVPISILELLHIASVAMAVKLSALLVILARRRRNPMSPVKIVSPMVSLIAILTLDIGRLPKTAARARIRETAQQSLLSSPQLAEVPSIIAVALLDSVAQPLPPLSSVTLLLIELLRWIAAALLAALLAIALLQVLFVYRHPGPLLVLALLSRF